jgi:hypothetical protein
MESDRSSVSWQEPACHRCLLWVSSIVVTPLCLRLLCWRGAMVGCWTAVCKSVFPDCRKLQISPWIVPSFLRWWWYLIQATKPSSGTRNFCHILTLKILVIFQRMCLYYAYSNIRWRSTLWLIWLRHCGACRKMAGSIPDVIIEMFHWLNPSGRNMAVGST